MAVKRLYLVTARTGEVGLLRGRDVLITSDSSTLAMHSKVLEAALALGRSLGSPVEAIEIDQLPTSPEPWAQVAHQVCKEVDRQVLFDGVIVDWRVAEGEPVPEHHRTRYQIEISDNGPRSNQFLVRVAPEHENPDEIEGRPQMDLFIEVNEGVPAVHLTPDFYDGEVAFSIFATEGQSLVVRAEGDPIQTVKEFDNPPRAQARRPNGF